MVTNWQGSFFIWHSLAHVNRELASRLLASGAIQGIIPSERDLAHALVYPHGKQLKKKVKKPAGSSLTIRHSFPPDFGPHEGPLVIIQPWEFLRAPAEWVDQFSSSNVTELWVYSNFIRNNYILSGVPPHKVRVLPLGYDDSVFKPKTESSDRTAGGLLPDEDEFRILYVGGTIERKGIDILMRAFLAEFRQSDRVRLVVKDTGTQHVYIHNNQSEPIRKVVEDPRAPRVTYITDDLPPARLADLMQACDVIAHPYRAEGFCLPVLEGMACGLAPIVSYGGPTDDFVTHGCGWKIATERVQIAQMRGLESRDDQGWTEPNQIDLQGALQEAVQNPERTAAIGRQAAASATAWTWDKVAVQYADRIEQIKANYANPRVSSRGKATTISLCMIVKNEERVIGECLDSVKGQFDEVIVVDTGSTDRTREICKDHGVTLRDFKWVDSFSAARNESMRDAKGEWIFWMDADDVLPEGLGRMVREAAECAQEDEIGFVVPVRFQDGTQVDHVKLFRNLPTLQWSFRIHEQILPSINQLEGRISRIQNVFVYHKNYDTSDSGQATKRERDWKLLDLDMAENPGHPFVLFNCGMTAVYTGREKDAIKYLTESIAASHDKASHIRKAYALLVQAYSAIEKPDKAREVAIEGLSKVPGDPELLFKLAQLEANEHEFDTAAQHYREALGGDLSGHFSSLDQSIMGYKAWHNLGNVELSRGDYAAAKEAFLSALREEPQFLVSAFALFDAALARRDQPTIKEMLGHVETFQGLSESWVQMLEKHVSNFEAALRQILEERPDAVNVRLALAKTMLNTNREDQAEPHLTLLASLGVAEGAYHLGVLAANYGHKAAAIEWMEKALMLNPGHEQTVTQLRLLKLN